MGVATITPGRKGVVSALVGVATITPGRKVVVSGGSYNNTWEEGGR